jgi:hypothetical protein
VDLEQEDPVEIVKKTIELYLEKRCKEIIEYISITSQKKLRISLRALYTHYQPTEEYPRFTDALRKALEKMPQLLRSMGFDIEGAGTEEFLIISREEIEKLCGKYRL